VSQSRISITRYAPIRALTRELRITPTLTICHSQRRRQQQHEFRRHVGSSLQSGYALLAQRPDMAHHETNRQVIHLSKAKRCLDQADHL